jgi:hypothetical protein
MEPDPQKPDEEPSTPDEAAAPTPDEEPIAHESDFNLKEYDKHRRRIRNTLFIISGLALFELMEVAASRKFPGTFGIACLLGISAVYAGLGFWSMKKPFDALIVAICFFCCFIFINETVIPGSISHGIILRIAVIIVLASQLSIARDCQRMIDASRNL